MTKISRYDTHLTIGDIEGVAVRVHYRDVPFHAGSTDGRGGPKLEPDEPAHIEIDWVEGSDGKAVTLTEPQIPELEEEVMLWLSGYYDEEEPNDRD